MNRQRPASFLALVFAMCVHMPASATPAKPMFRIEPLPFPPDNSVRAIAAYDLSEDGVVVGYCEIGPGLGGIRAFRASIAKGFVQLPHPEGSTQSRAVAISERGHVLGWEMTGSGAYATTTPTAWARNGTLRRHPGRDDERVEPVEINKGGTTVGRWMVGGIEKGWVATPDGHLQLIGGLMKDEESVPTYINDVGWVVGSSAARTPGGMTASHAFLWRPGLGMVDIGGDISGEWGNGAVAVNNKGTVIGHFYDEFRKSQAFVWTEDTGLVPLFENDSVESWAESINDNHWITGTRDGIGFLHTPQHGAMAIDQLIDPEDPNRSHVGALLPGKINRHGQIVASAKVDGRQWAVLLTPIGSPPAATERRRSKHP